MLVAVTVYTVDDETVDGVPEISPVDVSKFSPVGSPGVIDQVSTAPPLADGVAVVIAVPLVNVNGLPL